MGFLTRTGERGKPGRPLELLEGVRAAASLKRKVLSPEIHAEALLMLTDFPGAAVDFGKPPQRILRRLTLEEVENHLVRDGGLEVTICTLERAQARLRGDVTN